MDANLVGAPGFEPAFDQRRLAKRPEHAVMRHCPLAARHDRDLLAVGGRPRERRVDRACQRIRAPRDDRPIATIDRMRGELFCQADRSEEHTSELQSLMCISYAVFCLKKKTQTRY